MRSIRYLGPADSFDTGSMENLSKRYTFTSPGELPFDAFGQTWISLDRGKPVEMTNADAEEILSHPWPKEHHRFVDVTEEAPAAPVAAPDVLARTDVAVDTKPTVKEK